MLAQTATLIVPTLLCVSLSFTIFHHGVKMFLLVSGLWIFCLAAVAFSTPEILYYDRGRMNAAGVGTAPFPVAALLAAVAIYLSAMLGVPRKIYLVLVSVVVTLAANSQSWIT